MIEPKTFSELNLHDAIYWANEQDHGSCSILLLEVDPDDNRRTLIGLDDGNDPISFPDSESIFVDEETKYTTDSDEYNQWTTPFIEKQILEKEKRIEAIKLEIQELKDSIIPKGS